MQMLRFERLKVLEWQLRLIPRVLKTKDAVATTVLLAAALIP